VTISPFAIDIYEASNADFAAFVQDTGYVTEAEVFGNSFVMEYFISEAEKAKIKNMVTIDQSVLI
jgi:sulfatase modifying factor 1